MTDLLSEMHYSVGEVARLTDVDPCTVWRWKTTGVRVGTECVRLRSIKVGGKVRILKQHLDAFFLAINPQLAEAPPPPRTPAARRQACRRAAKELEELGVK